MIAAIDLFGTRRITASYRVRASKSEAAAPSHVQYEGRDFVTSIPSGVQAHVRAQPLGDNEWFTPVQYIDLARNVLGEIDVAFGIEIAAVDFTKRQAHCFWRRQADHLGPQDDIEISRCASRRQRASIPTGYRRSCAWISWPPD